MDILESGNLPRTSKFQLSPEFAATMPAEWVAEYNAWLAEFFGYKQVAYFVNPEALGWGWHRRAFVVMSPELMALLHM